MIRSHFRRAVVIDEDNKYIFEERNVEDSVEHVQSVRLCRYCKMLQYVLVITILKKDAKNKKFVETAQLHSILLDSTVKR